MCQDEAAVEAIVSDEFWESFSGPPENEVMQFDDRKRRRDRTIRCDPDGHLTFDCQAREILEIQGVSVLPNLTLEEVSSDRTSHSKLRGGARPRAADLIANDTVAVC